MRILYFVLAGIAGGMLAGMGMGGGTLTMPILVLLLGVGQLTAQLANLISFLPSGTAALLVHAKNGLVKWESLRYILPTALVGCAAVAPFAPHIEGELLKKLFGGFLIAVAALSYLTTLFKKVKNGYLQ